MNSSHASQICHSDMADGRAVLINFKQCYYSLHTLLRVLEANCLHLYSKGMNIGHGYCQGCKRSISYFMHYQLSVARPSNVKNFFSFHCYTFPQFFFILLKSQIFRELLRSPAFSIQLTKHKCGQQSPCSIRRSYLMCLSPTYTISPAMEALVTDLDLLISLIAAENHPTPQYFMYIEIIELFENVVFFCVRRSVQYTVVICYPCCMNCCDARLQTV